jgi:hypothetical protein
MLDSPQFETQKHPLNTDFVPLDSNLGYSHVEKNKGKEDGHPLID